ncbi:SDR family NAD(P)-dependent oxidoreductase [Desnuesiella massiliensis]|uniref:SDR family NAD(P)-dependent oxidoreductase n=1 Tax=Desnuesiella massiliensis TaxID=1650662 RepID=UPI0006E27F28|nr:SDR family oxidoreductase [Desnuesiella massiliensis]
MSKRNYVLITGASSGIGKEIAMLFGKNDYNLVLTARRNEALLQIKKELSSYGIDVKIFSGDLSDIKIIEELKEKIEAWDMKIDILINNAGIGKTDYFLDYDFSKDLEMINLNIMALTYMTKIFAKYMINNGGGKIINVASTGAYQPGPLISVYYATKAYVLSFSEALAFEFKDKGVDIKILCPGATKTEFSNRAGKVDIKNAMEAKEVAVFLYKSLNSKSTVLIPGVFNKISIYSSKLLPRKFLSKTVFKIQKNVKEKFDYLERR